MNNYKDKKVLIFGLGLLGGGVATTNWFLKQGAKVTITDLKTKQQLLPSLKKLKGPAKSLRDRGANPANPAKHRSAAGRGASSVILRLGGHSNQDIDANEIIVLNQDVSVKNEYIKYAFQKGKRVENEASIFFSFFDKPIVAVTGTRGKTTTVAWTNHFLKSRFRSSEAGNSLTHQFLKVLNSTPRLDIAVTEMPSFQLELFPKIKAAPDIAVITNIYRDHLNRHGSLEEYARAKANIFQHQKSGQHLILNYDNKWTDFLLKQKPKAQLWFFSMKKLPTEKNGVYFSNGRIYFQKNDAPEQVFSVTRFAAKWGMHNLENLLVGCLAAHLAGCSWDKIAGRLESLPSVPFREETIFDNGRLKIINDTTATSPEGCIAAIRRFGGSSTVLITGGTDRDLDYSEWAKIILKHIKPTNIVFISGSATDKMLNLLGRKIKKEQIFDNLADCLKAALKIAGKYSKSVVLFSPASKSFEKFKNEYDRGRKFNGCVKNVLDCDKRSFAKSL